MRKIAKKPRNLCRWPDKMFVCSIFRNILIFRLGRLEASEMSAHKLENKFYFHAGY